LEFIVDAQLPPALAGWLRDRGHRAAALRELGLTGADDRTVWELAVQRGAIVVTKDEDFAQLAARGSSGARVLWVRTGNVINRLLLVQFERAWSAIEAHLETGVTVVELR
jgi:predicted nuclease of predicted toxin-antitoxin system